MTLLDAYAVVAFLRREVAASAVAELLADGRVATTSVAVAECVDRMCRLDGVDVEEVALDLDELGLAPGIPLGWEVSLNAGALRARAYHARRAPLSLADCVAAETARAFDLALATADPALLGLCREEGIAVAPLPDSRGR